MNHLTVVGNEEQRMCGDAVRIPSLPVRTVKNHEDIRLA
jgi:hypothetical protein